MTLSIGLRHEVTGSLTCHSPIHIGGWGASVHADLTVVRDGRGRPVLPGTSLAGAVRAHLAGVGRFEPAHLRALFGYITPGTREGAPSWIRFDDAQVIGSEPVLTVRDGVAIDRTTASAATGRLYTRQVVAPGTRFAFRIVADTPTAASDPGYPGGWPALVRDAVDTVVDALAQGAIPIGARRGSGLGTVVLEAPQLRSADLSQPAGMVDWLTDSVPSVAPHPPGDLAPAGQCEIEITWRPMGPLLVRDSMAGAVVDTLPLTDVAADGTVRPVLPGSSIRGVLRSHAERIVRTLRGSDPPEDFDDGFRHPPAGVDVLFGVAPERDGSSGRRGVLSVADCHSLGQITTGQWTNVASATPEAGPELADPRENRQRRAHDLTVAQAELRDHLASFRDSLPMRISDHVAIDRWTGGASENRLFHVLEPETTLAWEPIRLRVDVSRLPNLNNAGLAMPLLLLVLRDLADGWLGLGSGVTRGHGQIQVTEIRFTCGQSGGPWSALDGRSLADLIADRPPELSQAMALWAERFSKEER